MDTLTEDKEVSEFLKLSTEEKEKEAKVTKSSAVMLAALDLHEPPSASIKASVAQNTNATVEVLLLAFGLPPKDLAGLGGNFDPNVIRSLLAPSGSAGETRLLQALVAANPKTPEFLLEVALGLTGLGNFDTRMSAVKNTTVTPALLLLALNDESKFVRELALNSARATNSVVVAALKIPALKTMAARLLKTRLRDKPIWKDGLPPGPTALLK